MFARSNLSQKFAISRATLVATALVAATLVALGPLAAGGASAAEGDDVNWGVRTATNDQGTDRQNYQYEIEPGQALNDALVISNHDDAPLELDLYAADGFTTDSGQLDVATKDAKALSIGAWVAFGTDHLTIPAGETVEAPFTLTVPENATPGDYAGGVITSLMQPDQAQGINVDRRLGIRIHLRVGGDLQPALAIENMKVSYDATLNPFGAGAATVSYTVRNTGNARLTAGQTVSITGAFGMFPVTATGVEVTPELLPGETWKMSVHVDGVVPAFLLTATAVIVPTLAEESGTSSELPPLESSATGWAVPWMLLLAIVLVAAAVIGAIILTRRLRIRRKKAEDARVEAAVAQALAAEIPEDAPVA